MSSPDFYIVIYGVYHPFWGDNVKYYEGRFVRIMICGDSNDLLICHKEDFESILGVKVIVNQCTRGNCVLDQFFTNVECATSPSGYVPFGRSDF